MIEAGLVYIHSDGKSRRFVGCGALVEGPFVVTCRHVWDQARNAAGEDGRVLVCFPPPQGNGDLVFAEAALADDCTQGGRPPDLVILEAEVPAASPALPVACAGVAETGPASALAGLFGRLKDTVLDLTVPGTIRAIIGNNGLRQFTGTPGQGFWLDLGSSGSPFGLEDGTTLAGILCMSEIGDTRGDARIHEAFLLPGSTIHRFLRTHVARRAAELRSIDTSLLPGILDMLGAPTLSLAELRRRLAMYFDNVERLGGDLRPEACPAPGVPPVPEPAPEPAASGAARVSTALDSARALSAGFEPAAAMAALDEALAEERRISRQRVLPLLAEKLRQQRLVRDRAGAIATLAEVTALDPDTPAGWIELGDSLRLVARYQEALDAIRAGLRAATHADPRDRLACRQREGDLLGLLGDGPGALTAYRACRDIAQGLLDADPGSAARRHDVATSHTRIGDMLRDDGDTIGALAAYRACLDILAALVLAEPAQAIWRQDLSVIHERIGDVLLARGSRADALAAYRASLDIRKILTAQDPAHSGWQQNLATAHQRIADLLRSGGDLPAALAQARAGLAISQAIAGHDTDDAVLQRELSVSHNGVGAILALQDDAQGALAEFEAGLAIIQRLCALDPGQTGWQQDLSTSHERIGGVLLARASLPAALAAFQASLSIRRTLCTRDPGNTRWQRELAVSHNKVGDTLREQAGLDAKAGDAAGRQKTLAAALESFRASIAIMEPLAERDPDNAEWQRDVSVGHNKIGDILLFQGDPAAALAAYHANFATAQRLAERDPDTADWQRDLLVSCVKMASVDPAGPRAWATRALAIASGLAQSGRLAPVDAWMIPDLQARLAALPPEPDPTPGTDPPS